MASKRARQAPRGLSQIYFSTRHLPVWLRDVMHVLSVRAGHQGQLWRIHNRALRLGLAQLWALDPELGPWPDPRGRGLGAQADMGPAGAPEPSMRGDAPGRKA